MNISTTTIRAIESIGNFLTVYEIGKIILLILLFLAFTLGFILFVFRKQVRLFKNLKKKIIFLNLTNNHSALEMEADLLAKSKFFSSPQIISDSRIIDSLNISEYSLIVLGLNEQTGNEKFKSVYTKITSLNKPVIIYTFGSRNIPFIRDEAYIQEYPLHTLATTPIRLLGDIFSVLSIFSNK